jgi:hypothetical protein
VTAKLFRTTVTTVFMFAWLGSTDSNASGESIASLIAAGVDAVCAEFASVVSAAEGTFKQRNQFGCLGAFQFCPATFVQYFTGTAEEFLNNPSAQTKAWTQYEQTQWALAKKGGLTNLLGQIVTFGGKSVTVDASAILMACQFGCGKFGKLAKYVSGHDCGSADVKDGNGVSVCTYIIKGAGHKASCFTSEPTADIVVGPHASTPPMGPPVGSAVAESKVSSVASCLTASEFGAEGPLEIVVGHYTFRFGSSAGVETIRRYLDVIDSHEAPVASGGQSPAKQQILVPEGH